MKGRIKNLLHLYELLRERFGFLNWWPGDTPFEVIIGAILTQNTSWKNVEKAVNNLKSKGYLSPEKMKSMNIKKLAEYIKPSGYYNQKAIKLKEFLSFFEKNFDLKIEKMKKVNKNRLRQMLLSVKGIGKETADSILLYALSKKIFVIDAYTRRILERLGVWSKSDCEYDELRIFFEKNIPPNLRLYKDFHAQFVMLGKNFCRKGKPLCNDCPLLEYCKFASSVRRK